MEQVVLSLGSNQGDRMAYLKKAISFLEYDTKFPLLASSVYQTSAWGFQSNGLFLNCVISLHTNLPAEKILERHQKIEWMLGRERKGEGYSSRSIDIDILFYGDKIIENEGLVVPHPYIEKRKFVLVPLDEILPQFIHPKLQMPVHKLLELCIYKGKVEFFAPSVDLF